MVEVCCYSLATPVAAGAVSKVGVVVQSTPSMRPFMALTVYSRPAPEKSLCTSSHKKCSYGRLAKVYSPISVNLFCI